MLPSSLRTLFNWSTYHTGESNKPTMATFALGLTKTAVAGTVSTVKSAIDEETKLRACVQDDLVFITGEFEMMQAFLSASGTGERSSKNQVVRTWVRQLRNLAFDVEDCVEFVVHLDKASRWDWFHRLASSVRVCVGKPPLPLDVAVADIKRLKARVEDIGERNTRYNLFTTVNGGADEGSDRQMPTVGNASSAAAATFQVLRKVWKDTGKLHDAVTTSDLKKLIDCQGCELQVISLWGSPHADAIGQLGWKAMVKEAYDDPCTCREFKNRIWLKLPHPFNPVEFLNTLLADFTSTHHHHHLQDMSELMGQVRQHKYLIVLEQELSSIADWEAIRRCLPDGNNGSRIIVSTRHLGIALACTREPYQVWELRRFFGDQYLYAFFPKGLGHRIGMGELSWQLRRPGVLSVLCNPCDTKQFRGVLWDGGNLRVEAGVEFERSCLYNASEASNNIQFELADQLLWSSYPEEDKNDELKEKINMMSSQDKFEMCRKLLTEQNWLICIEDLMNSTQWDLIKRDLLPEECTRGCILVITKEQSVAKYCVHHKSRALNAKDLLRGHRDGGHDEEEDKFEPGTLVGHKGDRFYNVPIMSFWGIAGVGKSALVREDYYYLKKYSCDYRTFGWVDVPIPFNLVDLCRRLLLDFCSDEVKEDVAIAMMEGQDPIQWCSKILHESNFLIVFDGLQSRNDWDLIKATLLSQPISGTSIVITREESIATHCTESPDHIHNIKGLEADVALDLFIKIAFRGKLLSFPHEAEMLNLIVSKCGGLPEIITAIAGKYRSENPEANIRVLGAVNADFIGILETMPGLRGLFCWMQSYFDACSDELKPCIFYLSVFPADQSIRRRRLLRRWIAEGYPSGGGTATDEKGEKLFLELLKLSILYKEQQPSTLKSCKVNGFFFEYIRSRPMEDNLVFSLEGSCSPSSSLTGQHLTISRSWDRDETVFNSIDLSRLRSLTVFGAWKSFLTSEKMKLLRVLDLEGTDTSDSTCVTDDDLDEIGKLLHRLKFLSVRGCKQITRLPDSLSDMRQLQTLDVRYTSIVEVPHAIITKLHKLQYIRAGISTDTSLLLLQTKTARPTPPPPPTTPPPPQECSHGGTSPFLRATEAAARAVQEVSTKISGRCMRRAHNLVASSRNICWQLKNQMDLRTRRRVAATGGGVELCHAAAKGIGRLTDLHTLGIVNIAGGKGAFLFLKELKKLTQLRKLGLSGINCENWRMVCDAISGNLHHLESLSLQLMLLDEEGGSFHFACFDNILEPPKTLKRLKVLYTATGERDAGSASIRPVWLKKVPNLGMGWFLNSELFDHELTISSQEDLCLLFSSKRLPLVRKCCLRVKPIQQQHISFDQSNYWHGRIILDALRIDCSSSSSTVTFGNSIPVAVEAISIQCCISCGSSSCLRISGLQHIRGLSEVRVKGSCSQDLKEDLLKQLNDHPDKPVPKLLC